MATRACRLDGGPFDGWTGEFVDQGQEVAYFGQGAEHGCYVYRAKHKEGAVHVWKYDAEETEKRLRAAGLVGVGKAGVAL